MLVFLPDVLQDEKESLQSWRGDRTDGEDGHGTLKISHDVEDNRTCKVILLKAQPKKAGIESSLPEEVN
jgi:hypothetical protein